MSYRIGYTLSGNVLTATISGSCPTPGILAREIARQARENSASYLLVDVRGLKDRAGRVQELLTDRSIPGRIAVVDTPENERLYTFAEIDAAHRGCVLKRFDDPEAALKWLWEFPSSGR
jgi:hypothetical protein